MNLCLAIAERSTCSRLKVGCVIAANDYRKILSWGYNGNATGLPNKCDRDEPGNCGCLHAEDNAVINCDAPRDIKKIVFVTHLPCITCAKRLINLGGIQKIYFNKYHRNNDALELFKTVNISIEEL